MCPNGTLPGPDHLECISLPEVYLTPESPLAIGAMTFALVGIVMTATVLGVYIRHNDTPGINLIPKS
jgi:metabotropic X receptor